MASEYVWGMLIALYLYLSGMSGGMFMLGFAADYYDKRGDKYYPVAKTAFYLAPWLLALGIIVLVLDLKRPAIEPAGLLHILNVFNNPEGSVMTIGSIIIAAAVIWGLITLILYYANASRIWRLVFGFIAAILGFATATYTGLLLGLARHIVLWGSGWLPWLFVASGVSSGIAFTLVMTRVLGSLTPDYLLPEFKRIKEKWIEIAEKLHGYDIAVLWIELAALLGFLASIYVRYGAAPLSWLLTSTTAAYVFWLYIVLGWLVPIVMYYVLPRRSKLNIYLGAILIFVFALALRYSILIAPQEAFLKAGFPFN